MPVIGSSPRVRGTLSMPPASQRPARFIPACAGNTPGREVRVGQVTVHPRVCGEHDKVYDAMLDESGSSPRVRGTPLEHQGGQRQLRFIPACAGNTTRAGPVGFDGPVHPRVCGEHIEIIMIVVGPTGSSPRVRGTHTDGQDNRNIHRFIPACAGNTASALSASRSSSVHPRVCGEHYGPGFGYPKGHGSSPRVRGTQVENHIVQFGQRFIPACAGNTHGIVPEPAAMTVHPRVCGEHIRGAP